MHDRLAEVLKRVAMLEVQLFGNGHNGIVTDIRLAQEALRDWRECRTQIQDLRQELLRLHDQQRGFDEREKNRVARFWQVMCVLFGTVVVMGGGFLWNASTRIETLQDRVWALQQEVRGYQQNPPTPLRPPR